MTQPSTKNFYDRIQFPGLYSQPQIDYHKSGIKNSYLKIIDSVLSTNQQVLDVGCGSGYITNLFAQIYPNSWFTAIDFAAGIDYGRAFCQQQGQDNVSWVKDDFLSHPFDRKFDVIICQGVFHHMPQQQQALDKLKTLCDPGGTIVFGVYHPFGKIIKRYFNLNYRSEVLRADQEDNPFERSYTCSQVQGMFDGYDLVDTYPTVIPVLSHVWAMVNSKNGGLTTYVFRKVM